MVNAIKKLCKVCLVTTMVLTPSSVLAQNVVKGTVLDANNEPVIGASVIEKGNPKNGTVTDIDGNFTLNLKAGKTAVISYIGMVAQEVKVGGQAQTIVLKDDNSQLNEVVVVGYTSKARTSVNMNANEVIANRALEIMGHEKADYQFCSPNDHCNCGQSTNDVYPTSIRLALIRMNAHLIGALTGLISAFRYKADEYADVIKMGRTQLQDAVPMSFGQEFNAYANNLEEEILNLERNVKLLHEINMGGTAIGTGLNAVPGFSKLCAANLSKLTGENFETATDLVEATPDTGAYVSYSSALKRLAIKLSKICNDLRLMASGPRCGLNEINLPPKAPGSSIMPGKVNPVIPEVTNQVCFKVIGNDATVSFAAEAGQLELNVMEPIITESLFESLTWLKNAIETLTSECILGITVNKERCYEMVKNSIGIVTALNPIIGYKKSTKVAKEAHATGRSVYDIVIEQGIMSKEELDKALDPKEMLQSHKFTLK